MPSSLNKSSFAAFVHSTKTGGTLLEDALLRQRCGIEASGRGHELKESDYEKRHRTVVTVLREPLDRLHSQFFYWRDGSSSGPFRRTAFERREHQRLYPDLASFVNAQMHGSRLAAMIRTNRMQFTWAAHFEPQAHWLNGRHLDTWVVCYNKTGLVDNARAMFAAMGHACRLDDRLVNPTKDYSTETLPSAEMEWVRRKHAKDLALWSKCAGRQFVRLRNGGADK